MSHDDKYKEICLTFFNELMGDYHPRDFVIRLWDGSTIEPDPGEAPKFTLVINNPGAVRRMFLVPDEVSMGSAYVYGDCDIEGNCESIFSLSEYLLSRKFTRTQKLKLGALLMKLPSGKQERKGRQKARLSGKRHSLARDKQAVTYHYDVSNDFFATYLDKNMVYSCGYFRNPDDDLDTAQENKLDYICRKLQLKSGERLLDIGCGWGGLIIHAAKNYGVDATGITLSRPQAELAGERIKAAGLSDRCRAQILDYRQVEPSEPYDKLVSVGMFEHVGAEKLPEYFDKAMTILKPGGIFLNHGIACNINQVGNKAVSFSDAFVFPDGELLPIHKTAEIAERTGFEVRDVESLREHYAMTLRHWVSRIEANREKAIGFTDEATYRVWRLYMSGSAYGFHMGRLNVYQTLLVNSGKHPSGLPLTREGWYQ